MNFTELEEFAKLSTSEKEFWEWDELRAVSIVEETNKVNQDISILVVFMHAVVLLVSYYHTWS